MTSISSYIAYTLHIASFIFATINLIYQMLYTTWIINNTDEGYNGTTSMSGRSSEMRGRSTINKSNRNTAVNKVQIKLISEKSEDASGAESPPASPLKNTRSHQMIIGENNGGLTKKASKEAMVIKKRTSKKPRKGLSVTDKIWFAWSVNLFISGLNQCSGVFHGFDRNGFIENNGPIGGETTFSCKVQAVGMGIHTVLTSSYALMMALQVYLSVVKGFRTKQLQKLVKYMHLYCAFTGIFVGISTISTAQLGPLFMWCWIPCAENGAVSMENLNENRCYARLSLYAPMVINCLFAAALLIPLSKMLLQHLKSSTTQNKNSKVKKGFKKTVIFLFAYVMGTFLGSASRIRSSFNPDLDSEGKLGSTEFASALTTIAGILIFGIERFYLPWKMPPYVKS